jgi:hypothetical protein
LGFKMNYLALVASVLEENRQVLEAVKPEDVEAFINEILRAETVVNPETRVIKANKIQPINKETIDKLVELGL